MVAAKELKHWVNTLDDDEMVALDEDSVSIVTQDGKAHFEPGWFPTSYDCGEKVA